MNWLRSGIFFVWFIAMSVVVHIAFLPALFLPRRGAVAAARCWCAGVLWGLRIFARLDYEVRGEIPHKAVLVASKHMTMWDTVALFHVIGDPVFVLKQELMNVPLYGWYARRVGMIAIDRKAGGGALRTMTKASRQALASDLSIVIFPEGTRKTVNAPTDYKPGVAALYQQLQSPCVPVALNSGLFWTGPAGFLKKRGRIVLQFLPPIAPGLGRKAFMRVLEERIEVATADLVREGRALLQGNTLSQGVEAETE
ncbi:MAG TPA: lysophospholipid acyltransferase family protein [Rhizomicrobium sp.]|jgi:1-acyl-sn-glycerol-3-phosphate acyltransferase|nr:lysophospholipid acyltransferase family protein [Rhizomicrobium sp.]